MPLVMLVLEAPERALALKSAGRQWVAQNQVELV